MASEVAGREAVVLEMLRLCGLAPPLRSTSMASINILSSGSEQSLPARARILITSAVADAESLSACEVFQVMLQAHLRVECAVVHGTRHLATWKPWAYYLVVLLFRGMFRDHGFAKILLNASAPAANGRSLELVSVIADTHFDFPSLESLEMEAIVSSESEVRLPGLDNGKLFQAPRLQVIFERRHQTKLVEAYPCIPGFPEPAQCFGLAIFAAGV